MTLKTSRSWHSITTCGKTLAEIKSKHHLKPSCREASARLALALNQGSVNGDWAGVRVSIESARRISNMSTNSIVVRLWFQNKTWQHYILVKEYIYIYIRVLDLRIANYDTIRNPFITHRQKRESHALDAKSGAVRGSSKLPLPRQM